MKKYFILLFIVSLIVSCSSNSTDSDDIIDIDDPIDVSTQTPASVRYAGQNVAFDIVIFTYDNDGKLLTAEDSSISYVQEYVYSGDRLTGIKNYTNNVLGSQQVYEYNNDLVSKMLNYNSSNELTRTRTYTYSNGVVQSYTDAYTDPIHTDGAWDYEYNESENSVKRTSRNNPLMYDITTYDQNKRPFYNLPSRKLIDKSLGNINSNNPLKIVNYFNGVINNTITYTNTYDNDLFLLTANYNSSGNNLTETYTYNE